VIKPPNWCRDAVPTRKGWEHPKTGEVYVSSKFSPEQIDEFYGRATVETVVIKEPVNNVLVEEFYAREATEVNVLKEAPTAYKSLESMTKAELEALGHTHGIDLDRRQKKTTLVERMRSLLG